MQALQAYSSNNQGGSSTGSTASSGTNQLA
jgi:hypothetical protein